MEIISKMAEKQEFLWVDKYEPDTIEQLILPKILKSIFQGIVKKGEIPNMILAGQPGGGKTTSIVVACKQIQTDFKIINASNNRGMDLVRVDIEQYAVSRSLSSKRKVLILDEADGITVDAQNSLRNQIEKYSDVLSFVLTCNHVNKLIPAIQSRCDVVEFKIPKEEKLELVKSLAVRIFDILTKEGIQFDKQVVVKSITQLYPDIRKILNRLQIYSNANGKIDSGVLTFVGNAEIKTLTEILKKQDFHACREWVVNHSDGDFDSVKSALFRQIDEIFNGDQSKVQFIVTSQKYQYQNSFSVDKEIHLLAYLIELMASCKF